jgi:Ulp1 family protease
MNINNLNYTYANVMQQPNQSSCGLFVIVYAIDISFNINVKK